MKKDQVFFEESALIKENLSIDILSALMNSWKILTIVALIGAACGFGGWLFLGNYHAKVILSNNNGISPLALRSLISALPNLAFEILDKGKVTQDEIELYKLMINEVWWKKAITPINNMSKSEIKDFGFDLNSNSSILYLEVDGVSHSKESAIKNAKDTIQFVRNGAIYLALKAEINAQQSNLIKDEAEIVRKIHEIKVELEYNQQKLTGLEGLAKRFPSEYRTNDYSVVPDKKLRTQYLPLREQMVAIITDMDNKKIEFSRLQDQKGQLDLLKRWIQVASSYFAETYDGQKIIRQLLELESQLRSEIKPSDYKKLLSLDSLRKNLLDIDTRLNYGLLESSYVRVQKVEMFKPVLMGFFGFLLITLIVLAVGRILAEKKQYKLKALDNLHN